MRARSREEFEAVFRAHYASVFGSVLLIVHDRGRAEEVTQDAFLKLYERWTAVNWVVEYPPAWVHQVAVRRRRLTMSVEDRLRTGLADRVAHTVPDIDGQLVALEQRAGRRRRNRVAGGVAVAAAIVVAVVWVPGITGRLQSIQPASGAPSLSVLDTRVPITPGLSTMLDADLAQPGEVSRIARLVEAEPTASIWQDAFVAETVDGRLCLWIIEEGLTYSRGSSNGCQPRSELLTSGVYRPWDAPGGPEGPDRMVILVPDGYTQVTAGGTIVPVANNAAVLGPVGDGTVVLTGPGKPNRTIRLDPASSASTRATSPTPRRSERASP